MRPPFDRAASTRALYGNSNFDIEHDSAAVASINTNPFNEAAAVMPPMETGHPEPDRKYPLSKLKCTLPSDELRRWSYRTKLRWALNSAHPEQQSAYHFSMVPKRRASPITARESSRKVRPLHPVAVIASSAPKRISKMCPDWREL